ncbi:MAG TPA: anti-sigma factor [Acidobacteriaceae bacterium]|nr:anti-sigma factor [Acidobacteriaceae bacterium]
MTPETHPGLDELILYCMGLPQAEDASVNDDQVRLHVQGCNECQAQVSRTISELSLLAMSAPQIAPPPLAKDRLMKAVSADMAQSIPSDANAGQSSARPADSSNIVPMKPRRYSPGLIWGGWVAAAACLFYAVQVHDANTALRQQLHIETTQLIESSTQAAQAARAKEVLELLSSPKSQRVTLVSSHAKPEPTGHAVYLSTRGALVFTASNLKPLPTNKTYELWVIPANGTAPLPAGTFQPDARGMASVLLPKLPPGITAKAFGVTMEKAGGATSPTMPILMAGG